MRNGSFVIGVLVFFSLGSGAACADRFPLFSTQESGSESWICETARVTAKGRDLVVAEDNPKDTYGSAYTRDRFIYAPDAVLEYDVKQVLAGNYSVQVLALKGNDLLRTIDLSKNSIKPGRQEFPMRLIGVPPETETVAFKIWAADAESAATRFRSVVYSLPLEPEKIVIDDSFSQPASWSPLDATWIGSADGASISPAVGKTVGAVEQVRRTEWVPGGLILLSVARCTGGDASAQLVLFDAGGNYLQSVDAIRNVTAGSYAVRLDSLPIPPETRTYLVKLWVGGGAGASAVFRRLVVIGR